MKRYILSLLILGWAASAQASVTPTEYAYGRDPLQTLDVTPLPGAKKAPILIMVHGGAWMVGDKTDVTVSEPKRSYFAQPDHGGFMFVSVNYRLTPQADAYDQAWDVAHAVQFVKEHAAEWGGDADRIILMGHSAGGHLVALLGANPSAYDLTPWRGTVVLDGAAFDVRAIMNRSHFPYYDPAFGDAPGQWDNASPLAQLKKGATPFFMVCTPQGPFLCKDAQEFADKSIKLGTEAIVRSENMEHIEINDAVGETGAYTNAIADFMQRLVK